MFYVQSVEVTDLISLW